MRPRRARIVVDPHFPDPEPLAHGPTIQLCVDQGAGRVETHRLQHLPRDELERAVEVADPHVQQQPDQYSAEKEGIQFADERIAALHAVSSDDVVFVGHLGKQNIEVSDVELSVTIHIEDEPLVRFRETRPQCSPVSAVLRVVLRPYPGQLARQRVHDLPRSVGAPIVDGDDFVIDLPFLQVRSHRAHNPLDVRLFVEGGQYDRQLIHEKLAFLLPGHTIPLRRVIIQCPHCNTRFRLAEERLGGEPRMLQCSRCRHIFPSPATQRRSEPRTAKKTRLEADLALSFDDADRAELEGKRHLAIESPHEEYVLGAEAEPAPPLPGTAAAGGRETPSAESLAEAAADSPGAQPRGRRKREQGLAAAAASAGATGSEVSAHGSFGEEEAPAEPAFSHRREPAATLSLDFEEIDDADLEDSAEEAPAPEETPMTPPRRPLGPMYVFLAAVVSAYFALYRSFLAQPELADRLAARLPVVGHSLAADRLLARKVALIDVAGSFHRTRDGKEVFLVTGSALNTAARPLRSVEIEAVLLDSGGQEVLRETAAANSLLSRRLVPDLTLREVEILRRVEPSPPRLLGPGESAPFAILFPQPPARAAAYECRVLAVQRAG